MQLLFSFGVIRIQFYLIICAKDDKVNTIAGKQIKQRAKKQCVEQRVGTRDKSRPEKQGGLTLTHQHTTMTHVQGRGDGE